MVARREALAAVLLFVLSGAGAQTTDHQRIGVERMTVWEASVEAGLSFRDTVFGATDLLSVDQYLAVDLLLDRTWSLGCSLPFAVELAVGDDAPVSAGSGIGDLGVTAGWTGRVADLRLSGSASLSCPTGAWGNVPGGPLPAGSGRWSLGLGASASAILDPVVLGLGLSYELGLPRPGRYAPSWQPGIFGLGLSVTEVLNDAIGYTIRLSQSLMLPEVYAGFAEPGDSGYSTRASFELFHYGNDATVRIGFSKSLGADAGPGSVSVSYSCSFRSKDAVPGGQE